MSDFGKLYIVATPIGNLEDITYRAVRILSEAAAVAAEDTRHTRKLLSRYDIHTQLTSYHDHNKEVKAEVLVQRMKFGDDVALVSDAGTPGISDPGYYLINRAAEEGIEVIAIPGPSASIAALSVSGLPTDSFAFEGFLPSRTGERQRKLGSLADEPRTMIFYEAPHRINKTLADMLEIFGDRRGALGRELTKLHEECIRGGLSDIIEALGGNKPKGEITLVVGGAKDMPPGESVLSLHEHVYKVVREEGVTKKEAIAMVAKLRGVPKRDVYGEVVENEGG
jgi:16S rRNA (cytidine1402-2'-O)-methyltransferase